MSMPAHNTDLSFEVLTGCGTCVAVRKKVSHPSPPYRVYPLMHQLKKCLGGYDVEGRCVDCRRFGVVCIQGRPSWLKVWDRTARLLNIAMRTDFIGHTD